MSCFFSQGLVRVVVSSWGNDLSLYRVVAKQPLFLMWGQSVNGFDTRPRVKVQRIVRVPCNFSHVGKSRSGQFPCELLPAMLVEPMHMAPP